ncbi:hypothetical protein PFICI_09150 [Pestalotiopsis fici W106-1]|uniref:Uncharacterized protein n=1 Tax=Pestalotiopsis fici (strain W106-1 / CGMCC3.15140) TaxID=1229662 RepID=W3X1Q4_PESFW|nr:uncharacterized protein PFICI_09150 [Pestalotiopsis fici W106-1]ETS79297.1 hypothetical protein PFICI_09150 [Pestalotiopsis fici W106-1]
MDLIALPQEILQHIAAQFCSHCTPRHCHDVAEPHDRSDRHALWAMCLTSTTLRQVSQNILYHSVLLERTSELNYFLRKVTLSDILTRAVTHVFICGDMIEHFKPRNGRLGGNKVQGCSSSWSTIALVTAMFPRLEHCEVGFRSGSQEDNSPSGSGNSDSDIPCNCVHLTTKLYRHCDSVLGTDKGDLHLRRLVLRKLPPVTRQCKKSYAFFSRLKVDTLHLVQSKIFWRQFQRVIEFVEPKSVIYEADRKAKLAAIPKRYAWLPGTFPDVEFHPFDLPMILSPVRKTLRNLHIDLRTQCWFPRCAGRIDSLQEFTKVETLFLDMATIFKWRELQGSEGEKFYICPDHTEDNRLLKALPRQIVNLQLVRCKQVDPSTFAYTLQKFADSIGEGRYPKLKCVKIDVDLMDPAWFKVILFDPAPEIEKLLNEYWCDELPKTFAEHGVQLVYDDPPLDPSDTRVKPMDMVWSLGSHHGPIVHQVAREDTE